MHTRIRDETGRDFHDRPTGYLFAGPASHQLADQQNLQKNA